MSNKSGKSTLNWLNKIDEKISNEELGSQNVLI